ncbi:SGNH/GDSL hydrolase family protein [Actinomadura darangshiensis]|uniref:SGNH/GDSL hydrolase family protein n=1 Tax=Actinomadura darangshiensis TaxID=705336 RepID=A0A4R5AK04_9ACTN|nr:SGNH/GDSL hydrolase family protein [Actinomadura darangshiensis]TDD71779.1 SGNH/GDSL hydrolase family protein [Actinomadura darangshiensis]
MKRPFAVARVPRSMMLIPLAPVLVAQAWRTVRRTPRLDPATGAEHGFVSGVDPRRGPAYRVVVIGESTAVGVGASRHAEALPGFLAEALRERLRRSVAWSVTGENGATARKITTAIVPLLNGGPAGSPANGTPNGGSDGSAPDLVVLTVGINDLIRRRPLRRWTADMSELIAVVRDRYADATVLVAGMPPVHRFPALPQPLRSVLGARARTMDRIMREAAAAGGAMHAPMDEAMARDRRLFASDGFHPSPAGYRAWAQDLAHAAVPAPGPAAAPGASPAGAAPPRAAD